MRYVSLLAAAAAFSGCGQQQPAFKSQAQSLQVHVADGADAQAATPVTNQDDVSRIFESMDGGTTTTGSADASGITDGGAAAGTAGAGTTGGDVQVTDGGATTGGVTCLVTCAPADGTTAGGTTAGGTTAGDGTTTTGGNNGNGNGNGNGGGSVSTGGAGGTTTGGSTGGTTTGGGTGGSTGASTGGDTGGSTGGSSYGTPSNGELNACAKLVGVPVSKVHVVSSGSQMSLSSGGALAIKLTGNHPSLDLSLEGSPSAKLAGICLFLAGDQAQAHVTLGVATGTVVYVGRGNQSVGDVNVAASLDQLDVDLAGNMPKLSVHGEGNHPCPSATLHGNNPDFECH